MWTAKNKAALICNFSSKIILITYVIAPKEANLFVLTFFSLFFYWGGSKNNFHHSAYEAGFLRFVVLSPKLLAKLESLTNTRLRLKGLMLVAQSSDDRKNLTRSI